MWRASAILATAAGILAQAWILHQFHEMCSSRFLARFVRFLFLTHFVVRICPFQFHEIQIFQHLLIRNFN